MKYEFSYCGWNKIFSIRWWKPSLTRWYGHGGYFCWFNIHVRWE